MATKKLEIIFSPLFCTVQQTFESSYYSNSGELKLLMISSPTWSFETQLQKMNIQIITKYNLTSFSDLGDSMLSLLSALSRQIAKQFVISRVFIDSHFTFTLHDQTPRNY